MNVLDTRAAVYRAMGADQPQHIPILFDPTTNRPLNRTARRAVAAKRRAGIKHYIRSNAEYAR